MSLIFIISIVGFCMMLGSSFPNHRRTHFPYNRHAHNHAFYQQPQPNLYYQQPFTPPTGQANASTSPLLYTLIFIFLLMAFMRFMA